ncbi:MAG TPA: septal ring lytic transglycosylase RlpA family protein [Burkholderiaceae bacterium]|nr:septal ring lytic transglycosylase RlpA family protein [Burkholderiaceae bacterium]
MLARWLLPLLAGAALLGCATTAPEQAPVKPGPPATAAAPAPEGVSTGDADRRLPPSAQSPQAPRKQEAAPPEVAAASDAPQRWQELARGTASWYGRRFHGRRTASGEIYDMNRLTAAHPSLPFGTVVRVRSLVNGREVDVRINDRGPHLAGRIIDLSRAAAEALGLGAAGLKGVVLSVLQQP